MPTFTSLTVLAIYLLDFLPLSHALPPTPSLSELGVCSEERPFLHHFSSSPTCLNPLLLPILSFLIFIYFSLSIDPGACRRPCLTCTFSVKDSTSFISCPHFAFMSLPCSVSSAITSVFTVFSLFFFLHTDPECK